MAEYPFRIIFHIDLNAFFASCELVLKPELEKKPVVVAGRSKRGVVTTANYIARTYGIHSAMPVHQALKKCPQLVVLPGNMELYKRISKEFMSLLGQYSDIIEQASIDEAYIDVTHHFPEKNPVELAKIIQENVYRELKIGCSIGVAPNKFLAKMASDMKKPNGISVLRKRDLESMLWSLPIEKMYGIGKSSAPKLKLLGIDTIGDLAKIEEKEKIEQFFGIHALEWIRRANGEDNRPVDPNRYEVPSSIGHSTTFSKDYCFEDELKKQLKQQCLRTSNRLKRYGLYAKTITLQLKYFDFKQITRSQSIENPIQTIEELYQVIEELFDEHWNGDPIRLVGVSTSNLTESKKVVKQLNLFNYQSFQNEEKINQTVSQLKKKYGSLSIQKGIKKNKKE